jgi:hypothetical protein
MNWETSGLVAQLGPDLVNAVKTAITSEPLINSIKHVRAADPSDMAQPAVIVLRSSASPRQLTGCPSSAAPR